MLFYACCDTPTKCPTLGGAFPSLYGRHQNSAHCVPQWRALLLHTAPPTCRVSKCHASPSPAEFNVWERGGKGSHPRQEGNTHLQGEFNKLMVFISSSLCYLKVASMYQFMNSLISIPSPHKLSLEESEGAHLQQQ